MSLPNPPAEYNRTDQAATRRELEKADAKNYKQGQDVYISSTQRFQIQDTDTGATRRISVATGVIKVDTASVVMGGAVTTSGLTQATGRLLGRTTASTGAIEEITPGATLTFATGALGLNLGNANTWTAAQSISNAGSHNLIMLDGTNTSSIQQSGNLLINAVYNSAGGGSVVFRSGSGFGTTFTILHSGIVTAASAIGTAAVALAALPTAAAAGAGRRAAINDSLAAPVYDAAAVGGGAVFAGVISDGAVWRYG